jgi:hypothetical protein
MREEVIYNEKIYDSYYESIVKTQYLMRDIKTGIIENIQITGDDTNKISHQEILSLRRQFGDIIALLNEGIKIRIYEHKGI